MDWVTRLLTELPEEKKKNSIFRLYSKYGAVEFSSLTIALKQLYKLERLGIKAKVRIIEK